MRIKLARCSQQALTLLGVGLLLCGTYAWAQNLGAAPQQMIVGIFFDSQFATQKPIGPR